MTEVVFSVQQVAEIFGVSRETIRRWTIDFERHLSTRANPGNNRRRSLTQDDLAILALVKELKSQDLDTGDIHASLDNGERGSVPEFDFSTLQVRDPQTDLTLRIEDLEEALSEARAELMRLYETEKENIRLAAQLEDTKKERTRLEEEVKELRDQRTKLSEEKGEQYAKGFKEGIVFQRGSESND